VRGEKTREGLSRRLKIPYRPSLSKTTTTTTTIQPQSSMMADPLSIASGVAAILAIAISIGDTLNTFVCTMRNAPKTVRAYLHELSSFKETLSRIEDMFKDTEMLKILGGNPSVISAINIIECKKDLQKVHEQLEKRLKASGIERLAWPFVEKEVKSDIKMLRRHRECFQMALSTDMAMVNIKTLGQAQVLTQTARNKAIMKWLCPGGMDETHHAVSMRRQKETGQWFIHKVDAWLLDDTAVPIFWCRGIRE
jgi:Fungal N-terminal domain of STAND proteins